jgi:hypothetical protein
MDYVTLIVVPEGCAPVRRRRVPRAAVRFGPALVLGLTLASLGLGAEWVRLRLEAVDVAALRAKAAADQAALAGLALQLQALETRLGRVADFERKVRIVADLPGGAPVPGAGAVPAEETAGPLGAPADGAAAGDGGTPGGGDTRSRPGGQGGDAEPPAPVSTAPAAWGAFAAGAVPLAPITAEGLDGAALERVRAKTEHLLARALRLDLSLEALLAALGRRRERLAAMPSIAPVVGWVTSTFGWRRSPFTGRRQFHAGLDLAAEPGAAFVATGAGRVVFAGVRGALGRTVVVEHGHGLQTTYGHAAALHVRVGQVVERGERLGAVGSSGRSTGPHVHYAVALRGRTVDPADYLLE